MVREICTAVAVSLLVPPSALGMTLQHVEGSASADTIEAVMYSTRGDEKIHILAADDLRTLGSIEVGAGLHEMAIDSSGRYLMGSAYGGPGAGHQPADNRVVVVDLLERKVHRTITLEGAQRPNDIAFVPGTTEAFVTMEVPQHVVRVDARSGEYTKYPLKNSAGHMLALAHDAKTVYVSHVKPGNLSIVDADSGTLTSTTMLPDGAEGMARSPDGKEVWVASHQASRISVVSTSTNEVTRSIVCPGMPFRMKFAPDGKTLAISCPGAGAIALLDTAAPTKIEYVDTNLFQGAPIGQQHVPTSIAFSEDGTRVFAVCSGDQAGVVAVDIASKSVTAQVKSAGPMADALTAGMIQWKDK